MSNTGKKKGAAVIPFPKRNESGLVEFAGHSIDDRVTCLRERGAAERINLILGDPEPERITRRLHPLELYMLIKELGEKETLPLVRLSSPEQYRFFLDIDLWEKWSFSSEKALTWFSYLMETDEQRMVEQLAHLDFELLLMICAEELRVGGGTGDILSDEERKTDWDHTFDDIFFINFREHDHEQLMGRFLDIVFRNDHDLYKRLMEGAKGEIESELEELCYRFRSARLADLGFPEPEEAGSIYGYLDPENFLPAHDKIPFAADTDAFLPVPLLARDSLLKRAMAFAATEGLYVEFNYLLNAALVAEGAPFANRDALESMLQRVCGYLNIALEWLSREDVETAAGILNGEYLKRLFQLGFSILSGLRKRSVNLAPETANHVTNRALLGLKRKCPLFYRGFDPDHADGYREFVDIADVRIVEGFLQELGG